MRYNQCSHRNFQWVSAVEPVRFTIPKQLYPRLEDPKQKVTGQRQKVAKHDRPNAFAGDYQSDSVLGSVSHSIFL
jgi:hypothetical protein